MTELLKDWSTRGYRCVLWLEGGNRYRACVLVKGVALACVETPRERGEELAVAAVEALVPVAVRNRGPRVITDETPIADIAIMASSDEAPEDERITEPIQITDDVQLTPVRNEIAKLVSDACSAPGYNRLPAPVDLRVFPYAFLRLSPPRDDLFMWDPDERLQTSIALSRLVRPTSISFGYAARLIGDPSDPDFHVIPGPVTGFGGEAWVADPKRNWLTPADAGELRELMRSFAANPLPAGSRLVSALWYHEYAARTRLIDIRFPLIATALESLISPTPARATRSFVHRLPQLADRLGLQALTRRDASQIWGRRSSLVHGAKHGGLNDEDFRLYGRMEEILRAALRRAVIDAHFRAVFDSADSLDAQLPVPEPPPIPITCPQCKHQFTSGAAA